MFDIVLVILAVVFVLGVAINIHEFGHFIVARLFGMRVEAFSVFGIGPRIWGIKRGHTDYRISAIPLGAYVKLYGDEATSSLEGGSSEGEEVPKEELYELRPRWQKFLVMLGGPAMNIILALAIPFFIAMSAGVPAVPSPVVGFVKPGGAAQVAGIKTGDRIVAFDGIKDPTWSRIQEDTILLADKETPVSVERDGKLIDLKVKPSRIEVDGNVMGSLDIMPDTGVEPVIVEELVPGMPAAASGLKVGDRITSVNGKPIRNGFDMQAVVGEAKDGPLTVRFARGGESMEIQTRAKKSDKEGRYLIGISFNPSLSTTRDRLGFSGAASYAVEANWRIMRLTGKAFGQMFAGERSVKEGGIAGPIGIVRTIATVAEKADVLGLFFLLMIISLNLGIFNLLPIPLLDGGQIAVLGVEAVLALFGLKLSMAIKESIQVAGLAIILLLMIVVFYFDIAKWIG